MESLQRIMNIIMGVDDVNVTIVLISPNILHYFLFSSVRIVFYWKFWAMNYTSNICSECAVKNLRFGHLRWQQILPFVYQMVLNKSIYTFTFMTLAFLYDCNKNVFGQKSHNLTSRCMHFCVLTLEKKENIFDRRPFLYCFLILLTTMSYKAVTTFTTWTVKPVIETIWKRMI